MLCTALVGVCSAALTHLQLFSLGALYSLGPLIFNVLQCTAHVLPGPQQTHTYTHTHTHTHTHWCTAPLTHRYTAHVLPGPQQQPFRDKTPPPSLPPRRQRALRE